MTPQPPIADSASDSNSPKTLVQRGRDAFHKYSENIGGAVSMTGSSLFMLGGDVQGFTVAGLFIAAEGALIRAGHTRAGYSVGAALFAAGDALAAFSNVAHDNVAFQWALAGMATTWAVGALRAPLALAGEKLNKESLVKFADGIQTAVGAAALVQRVPGVIAAVKGGSLIGAAAVTCWGVSDVLVGRLQNNVRMGVNAIRRRWNGAVPEPRP